ncbi:MULTISPECIES: hypothetical protein [unclassified Brachybacterium]|uniref:hypothetical protein n=1 Tax=unclassified Brachybacterium TaxID=2623841 RepID=UPI000C804C03|nr:MULTISPECIES: hypothetical protein [unclassified Brachybacterium]PMC75079.1 hypothetical protein CJ197_10235 [Brachybacterium sp. UMB0905]
MGVLSLLTGCGFLRPSIGAVEEAIMDAPGVTAVDLTIGPGGGLGNNVSGRITFSVSADELPDALDEAWRRGVEVIHRMDKNAARWPADGVVGVTDGAEMPVGELLDTSENSWVSMGRFFELYGLE